MPLLSINMATPINRDSQIYFLSNQDNENDVPTTRIVRNSNKKYIYFKIIELSLLIAILIPFMSGIKATESTVEDMMLCLFFGGFIVYSLLYIILPMTIKKNPITLIICNCAIGIGSITIGTIILHSWWSISIALEETKNLKAEIYFEGENAANMKLLSLIGIFINGLIFIPETFVMALEMKGYI